MYYKLIKFKTILSSMLIFILINKVLANENDVEMDNFLNISADQLSTLIDMVCFDLELDYMVSCKTRFAIIIPQYFYFSSLYMNTVMTVVE